MSASPITGKSMSITSGSRFVRIGALAFITGIVQFFIVHLIVEHAWPTPYSWAYNNISDLGAVTCGPWEGNGRYICSPLHVWMNVSFLIQGLLLILGLILTQPYWNYFSTRTPLTLMLLAGMGWILVGVAPADVNRNLHISGALLIFFCGNLGLVFAERSRARGQDQASAFRTIPRLLGIVGLVAAALFTVQIYFIFGMGGMERIAVFPLQIWAVWTGACLCRTSKEEALMRDKASSN